MVLLTQRDSEAIQQYKKNAKGFQLISKLFISSWMVSKFVDWTLTGEDILYNLLLTKYANIKIQAEDFFGREGVGKHPRVIAKEMEEVCEKMGKEKKEKYGSFRDKFPNFKSQVNHDSKSK